MPGTRTCGCGCGRHVRAVGVVPTGSTKRIQEALDVDQAASVSPASAPSRLEPEPAGRGDCFKLLVSNL